ncbi:MAG: hypothetical protein ACAH27_06150 [Xanthobacteraceae bacterium]
MSIRTRDTTVTFLHPFTLSATEGEQPAGTYRLVVDEEEIPNISFLAYRRIATMLHTPALSAPGGSGQVFMVKPEALARALEADAEIIPFVN